MINSKILRYISRKDSVVLISLKIFLSGFNMLVSLMIQIGLESIYGRKNNYLFFILTGLIIGSVIYSLCYYQNSVLLEKTKKKIMEKISLELMESYLKSEGNGKIHSGEILNLINEDTEIIGDYLLYGLFPMFDLILMIGFGFGYMLSISLKITLFYILISIIFFTAARKVYLKASFYRETYEKKDDMHNRFYEEIQRNIPIIKVYSLIKFILSKHWMFYEEKIKDYKKVASAIGISNGIFSGGVYLTEILSLIAGLLLVKSGEISMAAMIGIWNVGIGSILYPFLDIPSIIGYMSKQKVSVSRIFKYLDRIEEKHTDIKIQSEKISDRIDEIKEKESLNTKFENYQIVGENISFRYPDNNKMIFDKFNFIIPDKKITYIKESNGSGKTTLMEMILSVLEPLKGEIYGMKNGKKEIMEGKLGYVPQKSEFFNTTIFRNLTLDENYSEEEVADVLKKVNMYSVIEKFPKKLDTVFGENTNFSAGQLRRLSIARSLLFKPDFIFLDEPFSDLDIENQKILMTLFQELKNIMGIVIITHTYDFITENDNIIEVGDVNEK